MAGRHASRLERDDPSVRLTNKIVPGQRYCLFRYMPADVVGSMAVGLVKRVVEIAFSRDARRSALDSTLFVNSGYLMVNSATGAALGAVFWVLAARLNDSKDVGLASVIVSAAGLLAFLASLGLGMGLFRFLPPAGARRSQLINSCFAVSGVAAIALSLVFRAGLPLWSPALRFVRGDPLFEAAFVAAVAAMAVFNLLREVFVDKALADLLTSFDPWRHPRQAVREVYEECYRVESHPAE